jgi:hypothetical protein
MEIWYSAFKKVKNLKVPAQPTYYCYKPRERGKLGLLKTGLEPRA